MIPASQSVSIRYIRFLYANEISVDKSGFFKLGCFIDYLHFLKGSGKDGLKKPPKPLIMPHVRVRLKCLHPGHRCACVCLKRHCAHLTDSGLTDRVTWFRCRPHGLYACLLSAARPIRWQIFLALSKCIWNRTTLSSSCALRWPPTAVPCS